MTVFLDLEDLLGMVERLEVGPVRDVGLLEAAAARPLASAFGEDAYPRLEEKAAALLHSLAKNHALVDGNKRLAWTATIAFLVLNDRRPLLTKDEAFDLVMAVAAGVHDDSPVTTISAGLNVAQIGRRPPETP